MKLRPRYREIRRVALYLRVSTAEQAQGHSLDSQRNELSAWAEVAGWQVAGVYQDPGASGTTIQARPGFQSMIADAQTRMFDAVLVLKVDRFARSLRDSAVYRELLSDHGVRLLSRTEPTVGDDTPSGFLTQGIFDVFAAHYSVQLSHNVSRGKLTRAQKGLPLGDIPFGYRSISPRVPPEIVLEEGEAVRRIFEHYAAGNCSMLGLADGLNTAGLRPRSKQRHEHFSKATVAGMLSNPFYVGDITYHGEVVGRGQHEPTISRELWDRVQQARQERARRPQAYNARAKRPYLLAGIGVCSACNASLWPNTTGGGKNTYYRCSLRSRGGTCADGKTSCRSEQPETKMSDLFSRLVLPRAWRQRVEALVRESSNAVDAEKERRRLEERIKRVRQGLLDGVLDNETARTEVQKAEAALTMLGRQNRDHIVEAEALTDIHRLWPHMSMEERRDLVRLVLAKVEIDLRTGAVQGLIPKPAFAPLFKVLAEEEGGLISVCDWRPRGELGSSIVNRPTFGLVASPCQDSCVSWIRLRRCRSPWRWSSL